MIYGDRLSTTKMVIAAADTIFELLDFHEEQNAAADLAALLAEPEFDGFIFYPLVVDFRDEAHATDYCRKHDVVVVERTVHIAHQKRLIVEAQSTREDISGISREPTIAERLGIAAALERVGPSTTEDQIKKAAAGMPQAATSDASFKTQDTSKTGRFTISDIGFTKDASGNLRVGQMKAHDGTAKSREHNATIHAAEQKVREGGSLSPGRWIMFAVSQESLPGYATDATVVMLVSKKRFIDRNNKATIATPEELGGLPEQMIHISDGLYHFPDTTPQEASLRLIAAGYHSDSTIREVFQMLDGQSEGVALSSRLARQFYRFDITGMRLGDITRQLSAKEYDYTSEAAGYGESDGNVWYAFVRQSTGEDFRNLVKAKGYPVSDLFQVNPLNERFVDAKGATLKAVRVIPPRPWNDRASDLDALGPDDIAANLRSYSGREFFFARIPRTQSPREVRLLITPRTYFETHGASYTAPLNIDHLLPSYLKEVEPGIYATVNADWATVQFEMERQRDFVEQFFFTAYANAL